MSHQSGPRRALAAAMAITAAAFLTALAGGASAAKAPDLDGVWVMAGSFMDKQDGTSPSAPGRFDPDSPEAKQFMSQARPKPKGDYAARLQAATDQERRGIAVNDPTANCLPQGMPRFWEGPYAWEVLQGDRQINMFQEWNDQVRRIYLDGRKHPEEFDANYNGHSVGRWEGDTLVIDTVGLIDSTLLMSSGAGHSDAMHIVERMRLTAPDLLEVKVTVEDPKALAEPWTFSRTLKRKPGMEVREYNCNENNRNPINDHGVTEVILSPR